MRRIALISMALVVVAAAATRAGAQTWTRLTPPAGEGVAAFDPLRNRLLLLPLGSQSAPDDVWLLPVDRPSTWSRVSMGGESPPQALARVAVYDEAFDRLLLLARDANSTTAVWSLSLRGSNHWRVLAATTPAPPARKDFAFVYDSRRRNYLLFGGSQGLGALTLVRDLWRLDASENSVSWEALDATGDSIPAHAGMGSIYDAAHDRMVLFGGARAYPEGVAGASSDLMTLDVGALRWTFRPDSDAGHEVETASCIYDSLGDRMQVFDRYGTSPQRALGLADPASWSDFRPHGSPARASAAWSDARRARALLLGINHDVYQVPLDVSGADLRLDPGDDGVPYDRSNHLSAALPRVPSMPDGREGTLLVWGGFLAKDSNAAHTLWRFDPATFPHWTPLALEGDVPPPRLRANTAYDFRRNRWLVYGGFDRNSGEVLGDLWALEEVSRRWVRLATPATGPGPRWSAAMAYDGLRDRLIVFGGSKGSSSHLENDTWALPLAAPSAWVQLATAGAAPYGRAGASAVCDPSADRLVVFGGEWWTPSGPIEPASRVLSDTWSLPLADGARWDSLAVVPGFASSEHVSFYDLARSSMGVVAGSPRAAHVIGRAAFGSLALDPPFAWSVDPAPGDGRAAAFDPRNDVAYSFAREDLSQAWILRRGRSTIPVPIEADLRKGGVTAAILGTPALPAEEIDPATATLNGEPIRGEKRNERATLRDIDGDGRLDLVLKFAAVAASSPTVRMDARSRSGIPLIGYALDDPDGSDRAPLELAGDPDAPIDTVRPLALFASGFERGDGRVRLDLPSRSRVVFDVFAVNGRRIAGQNLGELEAGSHDLGSLGLGDAAAGIYFVRARAGDATVLTRFILIP